MKPSHITGFSIWIIHRLLTEDEADTLRAFISTQRPKVHLIMANWPWVEVRGLKFDAAKQLIERVRAFVREAGRGERVIPRRGRAPPFSLLSRT